MAESARRKATYQDVLDAPPHLVAEIINGDLRLSPRPALRHTVASSALGEELGPPFKRGRGGPGGWVILDEPELHLGTDVLVPDLAGWRRERVPDSFLQHAFSDLPPDWVCEVLSPSTSKVDRTEKLPLYAAAGVPYVWLIDPLERILEVLKLEGRKCSIEGGYADAARVRAVPFDAIELDLAWADVVLTP